MSATRAAVIDTSLLLTLSGAGALERCLSASRYMWHVTPMARDEVAHREARDVIDRAMAAGHLRLAAIDTSDLCEMNVWAEWELIVDVGEAEAIALALARRWVVGLDDRQAQRALDRSPGPGCWINSTNVLLDAVAGGAMSLADADAIFTTLDSRIAYGKRHVRSLADFLALPL